MDGRNILRAIAQARHGLFTTGQARRARITDSMRRHMRRRGEIEDVHRGVHRFTSAPWTWEARQHAAMLGAGPGGVASHASAARLLGLAVPGGRPEVTVTVTGRPRLAGVVVHRTGHLADVDRTVAGVTPCTTGSRTLVDLAARLTWSERVALVDEAIRAGAVSRSRLHQRAKALRAGRGGVGTLVEVTAPEADGAFWSALERAFGTGLRRSGLPQPRFNAPVRHGGRLLYADALWDQQRLVAELHGLAFHERPDERARDDERLNLLTLAGYRTLVFTWRQVHEDFAAVAAQLATALGVAR